MGMGVSDLDEVLDWIHDNDKEKASFSYTQVELGVDYTYGNLVQILNKLEKDEVITVKKSTAKDEKDRVPLYKISYEGVVFKVSGGYGQKVKDIKAERCWKNLLNGIVASGAGLGGLFVLWQFYKAIYSH